MTQRLHLSADQLWRRCRAVKRRGQSVTHCPIGDHDHVNGYAGLAAAGGGPVARTSNGAQVVVTVSELGPDDTFTADTFGRRSVYNADGILLRLRDRMRKSSAPLRRRRSRVRQPA